MFDETACDGILVARGAMGSPWIFKNIEEYLGSGALHPSLSVETRIKALKEHLSLVEKYGATTASVRLGFMKKTALWYLKDFPSAARARAKVTSAESIEQLLKTIGELPKK